MNKRKKRLFPKQIRLTQKQNDIIKQRAKELNISESEVVRLVLEREGEIYAPANHNNAKVFDEMASFARSLREQPELMKGRPIQWKRQKLYCQLESR